ncbi:hypothetical protein ACH0BP_29030 [Bacillus nitratireducens]
MNGESKRRVTRYLIEEVLKWSNDDIKEEWNQSLITKFKLTSVMQVYRSSPYEMLNAAYPNRFKEWELKCVPKNFWTKEKGLLALRWWIEKKEKLTKEDVLDVHSGEWLRERNLGTPLLKYWNNNAYQMLNAAYPNEYREWELKRVSNKFWNDKEKSLKIFKQIIKEKGMSQEI